MLMPKRLGATVGSLWVLCTLAATAQVQAQSQVQQLLIQAPKPYTKLVADIQALGGKVRSQYKNVDALAADVPTTALKALYSVVSADRVFKDEVVPAPRPAGATARTTKPSAKSPVRSVLFKSANKGSGIPDAAYVLNMAGVDLKELHKKYKGEGVFVAVIDSGIRPGYPHIAGSWSASRCENFVDDNNDSVLDGNCVDSNNDPHGTFVAGMIAGHTELDLTGTGTLLSSIQTYAPNALKNKTILPLYGSAPAAQIYAFRVFAAGHSAPESRIIDAIDRIIELRKSGVPILVANLSLGNATLFAGRDVFDHAVDALLQADIVPVVAAGNVGPSSLTLSSPATAFSALGVGASSPAVNERIFWDNCDPDVWGPCFAGAGALNRVFNGTQTAYFSGRGPTADGRLGPSVVANGFVSFGQGYGTTGQVDLANGTSFSTPIVSGVAAVLRQAHPGNTATQIRNAIIASAKTAAIQDGSTELDRGHGLVNADAADDLLKTGSVPDSLPPPNHPTKSVENNIEEGAGLHVFQGNVHQNISSLKPGERGEILYKVTENTDQVVINISHITATGKQNKTYGDDLFVTVHSAKTSQIHAAGDYLFSEFVNADTSIVLDAPETGIMRITLNGDNFNGGLISADVDVSSTKDPLPKKTAQSKIFNGDFVVFTLNMPANVTTADFRMDWVDDWSKHPTSDVDMYVVGPGFADLQTGATLDEPEIVSVANPTPGIWYIYAFGFEVDAANGDKVTLRVFLDGKVVDLNGKPVK